jgi:uncharacterized protein YbjQ (UPF0145 family)
MRTAEPPQPDDRDAAQSQARIEAGGIPVAAERRLDQLRTSGGAFTSDLSTADFALCCQLGLRPLSQVMGSSIYQVGYQGTGFGWREGRYLSGSYARGFRSGVAMSGGIIWELETLSEAWNQARERALGRLAQEAQLVGADAVVGVDVRAQAQTYGDSSMSSGAIEYSVIGTAVRRDGAAGATRVPAARARGTRGRASEQAPVLTELTVADYAKLLAAGVEPAGIVGWSAVFFSTYIFGGGLITGAGPITAGIQSYELREFTQAIYAAREQVMERMGSEAQAMGAAGIVGVRIPHSIGRQDASESNRAGLTITIHALGTAVHDTDAARPQAPKPTLDLSS